MVTFVSDKIMNFLIDSGIIDSESESIEIFFAVGA